MQRLHVRQANAHGVHKLLAERKRVLQKTHQHATDSVRLAHGAWRHRLPAAASTCPFDRMSLKTRRNDFFRPRRRRRLCDDSRYIYGTLASGQPRTREARQSQISTSKGRGDAFARAGSILPQRRARPRRTRHRGFQHVAAACAF